MANGRTEGYVLLFWTYFRYSGETRYEDEATEWFNRICEEIPKGELPLTFRNGIFGIGWAFIYLWEQGYVTYEEVEEELAEADRRALSLSPCALRICPSKPVWAACCFISPPG